MWHIALVTIIRCLYINSHLSVSRCICIKLYLICSTFLKRKICLYKLYTIVCRTFLFSIYSHSIVVYRSFCISFKRCNEFPVFFIGKILFCRKISIIDIVAVCVRIAKCNFLYRAFYIFIIAILLVYTDIIDHIWVIFKACLIVWISNPASTNSKI